MVAAITLILISFSALPPIRLNFLVSNTLRSFAWIKGENFLESFDSSLSDNFYALISHSEVSTNLTGTPKGTGIVAYVPKGNPRFSVDVENLVVTPLSDLI